MAITPEEIGNRVKKLQAFLTSSDVDVAILSESSDIYYYSGSMQPLYLVVPAGGEPFALARKAATRIALDAPDLPLEQFTGSRDLAAIFARRNLTNARRVGLTLDRLSYVSTNRLAKLLPNAEFSDIAWNVRMLRAIKSESEIAIQRRAGEVVAMVPEIVRAALEPGMTELELSALLESYFRLNGHGVLVRSRREGVDAVPFGVCSSGANSLAGTKFEGICAGAGLSPGTPYGASRDEIQVGVPIILDFAFNLDGYIVDQTRMASIGMPSREVLTAYEAMLHIEDELASMLVSGTTWEEVYYRAVELAGEGDYTETFMGLSPEKVAFVGHGVGLELDEPPYLAPDMKFKLEAGMVLAIEPKVALPGIGVVGIEDTYVVRECAAERITNADRDFTIV